MSIILGILLVGALIGCRFARPGEFHRDYLSRESTIAVNGLFMIFVFLRHFLQYVSLDGVLDRAALILDNRLDQLVVITFLFYSGYGVVTSLLHKGRSYALSLPKRALKVWLMFLGALLLYLILALCLGNELTLSQVLLSLVAWDSVGNSNWYVWGVIWLYLLSFAAYAFFAEKPVVGTILLTILTGVFIILMRFLKGSGSAYWYNTVFCYVLGAWYALFHEKLEGFLWKRDLHYILACVLAGILLVITYKLHQRSFLFYEAWVAVAIACVVLFTMKVRLYNPYLTFIGSHLFGFYILQRLPMIAFAHFMNMSAYVYPIFAASFIISAGLAWLYHRYYMKLISRIR